MNKRDQGLTNHNIACIIDELSDNDFLEVFDLLGQMHEIELEKVGGFITEVLDEIENK